VAITSSSLSPLPHALPGVDLLVHQEGCIVASGHATEESAWSNRVPLLMTAQAILANLLATAIVTTRAGRRASSALIQSASPGLLRQYRITAVAPKTSNLRK